MYAYLGLSFGDLLSGLLSQFLRSRKKVVFIYLIFTALLMFYFLFLMKGASAEHYYFISLLLGTATGYWAIFVTIASEQFGTNIRSTVTNTIPNFVRGSVPIVTNLFGFFTGILSNNIYSALIVGLIVIALAFWANFKINETFAKDLNYIETN
jgi:hypothetical protein